MKENIPCVHCGKYRMNKSGTGSMMFWDNLADESVCGLCMLRVVGTDKTHGQLVDEQDDADE